LGLAAFVAFSSTVPLPCSLAFTVLSAGGACFGTILLASCLVLDMVGFLRWHRASSSDAISTTSSNEIEEDAGYRGTWIEGLFKADSSGRAERDGTGGLLVVIIQGTFRG